MEFDVVAWTDETMCLAHIQDAHLLRRLESSAEEGECTICASKSLTSSGPVVNLEHFARVVLRVMAERFDHEGFVIEREQMLQPMNNDEVVASLLDGKVEFDAFDQVVSLTAELIQEERDWFVPYDLDHEAGIQFEWDDFEYSVKHVSRLLIPPRSARPETAPEKNHAFVSSLLVFAEERAGLVRTLEAGTELYRARIERDARRFEKSVRADAAKELRPAPLEKVGAGRMNPQGVPVLYVALDPETAAAEVASHSPYDEAVVGTFILQEPLRILDLATIPAPRSEFDDTYEEGDARLNSLSFYVDRITRPVILDDQHPVDYAPTQVLTDYFRWASEPRLDGIAYPSRIHGGTNVVFFFGDKIWFEQAGVDASRSLAGHKRWAERGNDAPIFVIDPTTVRRYRVGRRLTVERTKMWGQ
ncbi:hypothetical protein DEA06_06790 [Microbacterium sp. Gd 4-13]|uniref:RES domain-containing protein n=1 Tax=Microbacterium sp. Gd 4-13 TaxID=2173179 RepID=UPI000D586B77|nr:RES domain-containing protein [Microbacterium sp. Gd 4-13]PVW05440.1 hypothetical protein DEA06_06790 [Microbacterium sp. Gd 4-13]